MMIRRKGRTGRGGDLVSWMRRVVNDSSALRPDRNRKKAPTAHWEGASEARSELLKE